MQRLRGAAALVRVGRAARQLAVQGVASTPLAAQSLANIARQCPGASALVARTFSTKARPQLCCGATSGQCSCLQAEVPVQVIYPPCTAEIGKPAPDYSGTGASGDTYCARRSAD